MPDVMYYQVNEIFHKCHTLTSLRAFLRNSLVGKFTLWTSAMKSKNCKKKFRRNLTEDTHSPKKFSGNLTEDTLSPKQETLSTRNLMRWGKSNTVEIWCLTFSRDR